MVFVGAAVIALLLEWPVYGRILAPNRVTIRNETDQNITGLRMTLRDCGTGTVFRTLEADSLRPGSSATIRHGRNDLSQALRYMIAGEAVTYSQAYVDLWRGEGWVLAIRPNGRVQSGHDYDPRTVLRDEEAQPEMSHSTGGPEGLPPSSCESR